MGEPAGPIPGNGGPPPGNGGAPPPADGGVAAAAQQQAGASPAVIFSGHGVPPFPININLTFARDRVLYAVAGAFIIAEGEGVAGNSLDLFLDQPNGDPVIVRRGSQIQTPFSRFYITNAAQAAGSSLRLIVGGRGYRESVL